MFSLTVQKHCDNSLNNPKADCPRRCHPETPPKAGPHRGQSRSYRTRVSWCVTVLLVAEVSKRGKHETSILARFCFGSSGSVAAVRNAKGLGAVAHRFY